MQIPLFAAAIAVVAILSPAPQEPTPAPAPDPYPAVRHATVVRFFVLDGDLRPDGMNKVLTELSTKETECRALAGPMASSTRPKKHFLALEVPAHFSLKETAKALRKCTAAVEEIEWTLFRGAREGPGPILGYSGRDCVIGMSSDMRWFEYSAGDSAFFFVADKHDAKQLIAKYRTLYQPFGGGELGMLARDTIAWSLATPIDAGAAKRAEKAITKVAGVREVKIDAASGTLRAVVELDGLGTSAPPLAAKSDSGQPTSIIPRFNTNAILDELEKEKLALAPPTKSAESDR